jgi:hypothetical protein
MGSLTGKPKTRLKAKGGTAKAMHLQHGKHEAIAIWNLSVLIVPDENSWFAQGLEVNYGAQGNTPEEAQENFQRGLLATIRQHLRVHGDITRILKFAPSQILHRAAENRDSIKHFAYVTFQEILAGNDTKIERALPFGGIDYRVMRQAA